MQIKRKPTAWILAGAYLAWDLLLKPIWTLNIERAAEQGDMDKALTSGGRFMEAVSGIGTYFNWLASYIPSSFGLGFVVGGLLFAYWDNLVAIFKRYALRQTAPIQEPDEIKAWAGDISVHFRESQPDKATLFIRALNWGKLPFSLKSIEGHIVFRHDDGNHTVVHTKLPTPTMAHDDSDLVAEPGYIMILDITQPIPARIVELMPDVFRWKPRPYFELGELEITLEAPNGQTKRLKLCDSIRLTTGDWAVRSNQAEKMFNSEEEAREFRQKMLNASALLARLGN